MANVPRPSSQRAEYERLCKEAVKEFRWRFGEDQSPSIGVYAPGRVNLIGEHTDYNGGCVLPMALHLVTVILGRPSPSGSGNCRLITAASTGETGYHEFPVPQYPTDQPWEVESEGPFWATYVKGVVALMNRSTSIPPFDAIIATSVPLGGGLSSSAALEVATCQFIEQLCPGVSLGSPADKALLCQRAEHRYAGMPCGIMDQFVSVMGKDKHALFIDCRTQKVKDVPMNNPELVVLVTNSNYRHRLGEKGDQGTDKEYEKRRRTCESAARKLGKEVLKDVTLEELEARKGDLEEVEYRRARHVVTEIQRTYAAVEALSSGDYRKFGELMVKSHNSLRDDYEVSCSELDELVELALQDKENVFGSRMTGGGFGGCTVTLMKRTAIQTTVKRIQDGYQSRDGEKATFYIATPCGGAGHIAQKIFLGRKVKPGLSVSVRTDESKGVKAADLLPPGIDATATITIDKESYKCRAKEMREEGELGRGAFGSVHRMRHRTRGTLMAVKRIRATIDPDERRRLLMDVNVAMKSLDCPYTVTFYGTLFHEGDVWIFMELMDRSLDQLYKLVYERLHLTIPEIMVGKMAEATVKALHFLKATLNVLHRDVKPSNILINKSGEVKLCDFGIAAETVNSFTKTNIGSKPYLAPERINPGENTYFDQRSDVWSYGITLYELAVGKFPYPISKSVDVFKQLELVVEGEAPRVPDCVQLSQKLKDFIHKCLTKEVEHRPTFQVLLEHPFIKTAEEQDTDIGVWFRDILEREKSL